MEKATGSNVQNLIAKRHARHARTAYRFDCVASKVLPSPALINFALAFHFPSPILIEVFFCHLPPSQQRKLTL
jgi:hypothetical protein